jgi:hypothetical protein
MEADAPALPLDDPRWRDLRECFGSAERIPDLLRRLGPLSKDEDDVWGEMFQHLCHQSGTVYSASFAAVPHVVRFAESVAVGDRVMPLVFVASVERCRIEGQTREPAPGWALDAYHSALRRARELTCASMSRADVSDLDARYLLFACAVFMAKTKIAHVIEDLPNLECSSCGAGMLDDTEQ